MWWFILVLCILWFFSILEGVYALAYHTREVNVEVTAVNIISKTILIIIGVILLF